MSWEGRACKPVMPPRDPPRSTRSKPRSAILGFAGCIQTRRQGERQSTGARWSAHSHHSTQHYSRALSKVTRARIHCTQNLLPKERYLYSSARSVLENCSIPTSGCQNYSEDKQISAPMTASFLAKDTLCAFHSVAIFVKR